MLYKVVKHRAQKVVEARERHIYKPINDTRRAECLH
jgi:hypothetical protein